MLENKLLDIYKETKTGETSDEMFFNFKDFDVYELKLSSYLAFYQRSCFDPSSYKLESNLSFIDDKGKLVEKDVPRDCYMRWKYDNENSKNNKN
jgi:hypothetical protein